MVFQRDAPYCLNKLTASGSMECRPTEVFENIGMVIGLMPVTGITLPLLSYGGSSMLSVMIGIGLLVNISMRRHMF